MEDFRIVVDLTYHNRETCINEFERICKQLKETNYRRTWAGSGKNYYGVKGPSIECLTDEEIIKLRGLIK